MVTNSCSTLGRVSKTGPVYKAVASKLEDCSVKHFKAELAEPFFLIHNIQLTYNHTPIYHVHTMFCE
jgi:hypothetical protein